MQIVRARDARAIETPNGNSGVGLATPDRGAHEVSVVRQRQTPGGFNPVHTHDRDEVMVLLAGAVTVAAGDTRAVLGPGDAAIVPAGTPHRVDNAGDTDAEWLIVSAAGVRFFREDGEEAHPDWSR